MLSELLKTKIKQNKKKKKIRKTIKQHNKHYDGFTITIQRYTSNHIWWQFQGLIFTYNHFRFLASNYVANQMFYKKKNKNKKLYTYKSRTDVVIIFFFFLKFDLFGKIT